MTQPHFLVLAFPARGHINPSLHFCRRLIRTTAARVTFVTCVSAFRRSMISPAAHPALSFLSFSDGYDDGAVSTVEDYQRLLVHLRLNGIQTLTEFIESSRHGDSPVTCLVSTILFSWAPNLARRLQLPSAALWVQPTLVFDIYYYYFNGYSDVFSETSAPSDLVEFPKLPSLTIADLPTFIAPSNTYKPAAEPFQELMEYFRKESHPIILVNTFDALEPEALTAIPNLKLLAVGPLLPSEIFSGKMSLGHPIRDSGDHSYTLWLDSKPESSVIYVCFGTVTLLSKKQLDELARALIEVKRPFLWAMPDKPNRPRDEEGDIDRIADLRHKLEETGMILPWCSQVEVLKHKSIGCFLTHCGWNSTLESLALGVPVVAFPRISDQTTNAKLLEDSWRTGVRVREDKEGLVESGEIQRCLVAVMEEKAAELRRNAAKWRDLAAEAGREGGCSDKNTEAFVESCSILYETEKEKGTRQVSEHKW